MLNLEIRGSIRTAPPEAWILLGMTFLATLAVIATFGVLIYMENTPL